MLGIIILLLCYSHAKRAAARKTRDMTCDTHEVNFSKYGVQGPCAVAHVETQASDGDSTRKGNARQLIISTMPTMPKYSVRVPHLVPVIPVLCPNISRSLRSSEAGKYKGPSVYW